MQKDFESWNRLKQKLDKHEKPPSFSEREIGWCSIGLNIGDEENGKNASYNRPVLIIKKCNKHLFWGVALSTKRKDNPNYCEIEINGEKQSAMLSHLRLYDSRRLNSKPIAKLAEIQFVKVKQAIKDML